MASWRRVQKWHGTFRRTTWVSANIIYINNLPANNNLKKKEVTSFYSLLTNVTLEQPPNWTKSACFADKWVQYIYSAKRWRRIRYARCIDWGRDIRYAVTSFSFSLSPLLDICIWIFNKTRIFFGLIFTNEYSSSLLRSMRRASFVSTTSATWICPTIIKGWVSRISLRAWWTKVCKL